MAQRGGEGGAGERGVGEADVFDGQRDLEGARGERRECEERESEEGGGEGPGAKRAGEIQLDCRVAALLAMTGPGQGGGRRGIRTASTQTVSTT